MSILLWQNLNTLQSGLTKIVWIQVRKRRNDILHAMTEKKHSVPKNTLEHPSMEGKYVVVGYEGVDPDEEITTILIFKIVKGKAVRIFGVEDFPEYQGSGDPGLSEQVLEKIREHKITELYQLSNTSGKDFKYLPKTKTFGINFFSKNIKINEETKEVD
jgi:hypothetical protein